MKKVKFLVLLTVFGCIQTDLEDPFVPTVRIDNSVGEIDFRISGSYPLKAVYTDDTGEEVNTEFSWSSSNEEVISLDGNIASVHREGFATLKVSVNGIEDELTVETQTSRGSLSISGSVPKIQIGNSSSFRFNFIDANGTTNNMANAEWSSSDESIAFISPEGSVNAINPGTTNITVTVDGLGQTATLDVTVDPVEIDPAVRILSFAKFLSVGEIFQFEADFLRSNGQVDQNASINWSSSNENVLSIDENGSVLAASGGVASITASYNGWNAEVQVSIEGEANESRSGMLRGTGYSIEGSFSLEKNDEGDLILTIENYKPDGPGPYFYLTNQENNVNNGLNLGDAGTAGSISINVSEIDESVQLNSFNYLMIWCEPFNVRLGVGAFDN
ncbi:MAG: Ig-like domain-containing protein [Ekhidna sp.]|nr:Ig-like domain-containing protein [Ekhidna sp.]